MELNSNPIYILSLDYEVILHFHCMGKIQVKDRPAENKTIEAVHPGCLQQRFKSLYQ